MSDNIESEIERVLKRYAAEFLALNAEGLIQLWDSDSATLATYLPPSCCGSVASGGSTCTCTSP